MYSPFAYNGPIYWYSRLQLKQLLEIFSLFNSKTSAGLNHLKFFVSNFKPSYVYSQYKRFPLTDHVSTNSSILRSVLLELASSLDSQNHDLISASLYKLSLFYLDNSHFHDRSTFEDLYLLGWD